MMPTLVQINTVVNYSSTGRIAEGIGQAALASGWRSVIAFGRHSRPSSSEKIDLGDSLGTAAHVLLTRFADRHGLHSRRATIRLVRKLARISPDVVQLHNLHGYYLDYRLLFDYLAATRCPVVWTLHDCWPFTGHCCYFDEAECTRWMTGCGRCPLTHTYPASIFADRSSRNWSEKRVVFTSLKNMHIVVPSNWLGRKVAASFLGHYQRDMIAYGVNLDDFKPLVNERVPSRVSEIHRHVVLAVASDWGPRKGLDQVVALRKVLPRESFEITVVGVTRKQAESLPEGISPIQRTENIEQLAMAYSQSSVFFNPSLADNFPVTNLEALACGTPVVTYDTGGSPEAIDASTGAVVGRGDVAAAASEIRRITALDRDAMRMRCRDRAVALFSLRTQYARYQSLYQSLLGNAAAVCKG